MKRYKELGISVEKYESIVNWLDSKNDSTKSGYTTDMKKFIVFASEQPGYTNPEEFLDFTYEKNKDCEKASDKSFWAEDEIRKYIKWLVEEGQATNTIKRGVASLLSYIRSYV